MSEIFVPGVPGLAFDDHHMPYLQGARCTACDARFPSTRQSCAACGQRRSMEAWRLPTEGTLRSYSIVHRSYPGIAVPFVSAIISLAGGLALKGRLEGVAPTPEALVFGLPVNIIFSPTDHRDTQGNRYMAYHFQPVQSV
jgi:uncharacterized protein